MTRPSLADPSVHSANDTGADAGTPIKKVRRSLKLWTLAVTGILALGGAGALALYASASASPEEEQGQPLTTVKVEQGTLSGTRTVPGVLDYSPGRDQSSEFAGTLTRTPAAGSVIDRGGALFAVDNKDVYLFTGSLPAWRPFESHMSDGPDVLQLEQNLKALGFFGLEPDDDFTWDTVEAIYDWQDATGQEETGTVELGRVVFTVEPSVRVAGVVATVGDKVGPGVQVVTLSGLAQQVTADLKLADQKLAVLDAPVEVQLPGGVTAMGKIKGVGQPTEREANGTKSVVIPLTIILDDAAETAGIQKANVTVDVPSETRENVLFVPVEALVALPNDGGFGVEVVKSDGTTSKRPVTTGLFAGGRVEITGDSIKAGTEVVVPGA